MDLSRPACWTCLTVWSESIQRKSNFRFSPCRILLTVCALAEGVVHSTLTGEAVPQWYVRGYCALADPCCLRYSNWTVFRTVSILASAFFLCRHCDNDHTSKFCCRYLCRIQNTWAIYSDGPKYDYSIQIVGVAVHRRLSHWKSGEWGYWFCWL